MPPTYREVPSTHPTKDVDGTSAVSIALSVADESERVSQAAQALAGLGPHATMDDLLGALDTALHRVSGLGMVSAQGAIIMADDQRQRAKENLRIEARLMRIENQLRRKQSSDRRDLVIVILLVLLAFSVGANLF